MLCFTLYLRTISEHKAPRGAYIWRGDLTEGFLRYRFGGLIFGGAYTWRGLFSEFYGNLITDLLLINLSIAMAYRREVWYSPVGDEISNPGLNCSIVSLHCLFITWIFISVVSWYVCTRNLILGACIIHLFKLRVHLVCLITS